MAEKTFINRLQLTDFRNYGSASLRLDSRHVVLTGNNGSGKTNLMEAVSFLSPGRGLRRAVLSDVARAGAAGGFSIFASLEGMAGDVELGTGSEVLDETAVRRLRINGATVRSVDELTDHLRVLWLTPAMDGLFTGSSSERRRFLDRLVLSIDPQHGRRASDFERAMRSRNKLLSEGRFDASWLAGIEQQMAALGIAMALARQEMMRLLAALIEQRREPETFPGAELMLSGFMDDHQGTAAIDLEDSYRDRLAGSRGRDAAAGRTLEGPHRSDLLVRHREKDMEAERCSTGEQKALLIGLILAHAELVATMTGFAPILLLDEIAAHLDEGRRAALFDRIDVLGGQAFMTGTDGQMFASLGDRAQFVTVDDGHLSL
ncbi:DNA replication/repair protein RecF [Agrobacterium vitis]|uniref:DNA replication and repair protein RecF n=1 Tax=Agrobacterium vitis TaxID=373 RepID=A0ABD6GA76_AGRVI|nr:DNA replication/repair protein RecF [Agrobacterium vitis]MUO80567.1 DNA replication/repair protein RecF [Agrobacterium vitis]MUO93814.1 DNA replication/repair protein RecF [Agrobacterium vitis]MUP03935.1 DNA replication/repair protein RecF [Agrobacterium vitis]MUZ83193.1 DNA replication/repair protein RecF [Agrobacterium vitis]MVA10967.1 DNA replication/repair protein RecF [Agrobacterium vitis]